MDDLYVIVVIAIVVIKMITSFFKGDDSKTILTTEPEEEELLQPLPDGEVTTVASPTTTETRSNQQAWNRRKPKAATRHQTVEKKAAPTVSVTQIEAESNEEFQINSAEEARKAIIWGEILQRKY